ncbi:hypothetical protein DL95DRAFT_523885, partial [Leptodontidium sp. 2 PMI_412]
PSILNTVPHFIEDLLDSLSSTKQSSCHARKIIIASILALCFASAIKHPRSVLSLPRSIQNQSAIVNCHPPSKCTTQPSSNLHPPSSLRATSTPTTCTAHVQTRAVQSPSSRTSAVASKRQSFRSIT